MLSDGRRIFFGLIFTTISGLLLWNFHILSSFSMLSLTTMTNTTSSSCISHTDNKLVPAMDSALAQTLLEAFVWEQNYEKWRQPQRKRMMDIWTETLKLSQNFSASVKPYRVYHMFPKTFDCANYTRIGGSGDGGKMGCLDFFDYNSTNNCTVISLGSRGDFSFEQSILQQTGYACTVHTLDCTGYWTSPHRNIHFHQWCMGGIDKIRNNGEVFKTWKTILKELNIQRVDLLKMDIEGYEWTTLPFMLQHPDENKLPKQILFEMHMFPFGHVKEMFEGNYFPPGTPPEMMPQQGNFLHPLVRLFHLMYSRGYHVANYEYNPQSIEECCQEFTMIRK